VCIADGLAPDVDRAFSNPSELAPIELALSMYFFSIQVYCDFLGYTDIARGVARLLGVQLSQNFRQPYLSTNMEDLWRRWHMTLVAWLRDYFYIPMGGNRRGTIRTHLNLILTMTIAGLWHGANWTFVIWGTLHGLLLSVHRLTTRRGGSTADPGQGKKIWWREALKIFGTFQMFCILAILFRSPDLGTALEYYAGFFGVWSLPSTYYVVMTGVYFVLMLAVDVPCWLHDEDFPVRASAPPWRRGAVLAAMIVLISLLGSSNVRPFIYFQF
jgi:D-alanyl-lipoteichoic acid acyltransferase DltB (MBOAT superfamily)